MLDINEQIDSHMIIGAYLHFDPDKCLYSDEIYITHPFWGKAVTGVFKYQGNYYFYTIEEGNSYEDINKNKKVTDLWLQRADGLTKYKFYGFKTKAMQK